MLNRPVLTSCARPTLLQPPAATVADGLMADSSPCTRQMAGKCEHAPEEESLRGTTCCMGAASMRAMSSPGHAAAPHLQLAVWAGTVHHDQVCPLQLLQQQFGQALLVGGGNGGAGRSLLHGAGCCGWWRRRADGHAPGSWSGGRLRAPHPGSRAHQLAATRQTTGRARLGRLTATGAAVAMSASRWAADTTVTHVSRRTRDSSGCPAAALLALAGTCCRVRGSRGTHSFSTVIDGWRCHRAKRCAQGSRALQGPPRSAPPAHLCESQDLCQRAGRAAACALYQYAVVHALLCQVHQALHQLLLGAAANAAVGDDGGSADRATRLRSSASTARCVAHHRAAHALGAALLHGVSQQGVAGARVPAADEGERQRRHPCEELHAMRRLASVGARGAAQRGSSEQGTICMCTSCTDLRLLSRGLSRGAGDRISRSSSPLATRWQFVITCSFCARQRLRRNDPGSLGCRAAPRQTRPAQPRPAHRCLDRAAHSIPDPLVPGK